MKYECKKYKLILCKDESMPKSGTTPKYLMIQTDNGNEKKIQLSMTKERAYVDASKYSKKDINEVKRLFRGESKKKNLQNP